MLILLTLLVPLLGGALVGVLRPSTNRARALLVEAVVIATSIWQRVSFSQGVRGSSAP